MIQIVQMQRLPICPIVKSSFTIQSQCMYIFENPSDEENIILNFQFVDR